MEIYWYQTEVWLRVRVQWWFSSSNTLFNPYAKFKPNGPHEADLATPALDSIRFRNKIKLAWSSDTDDFVVSAMHRQEAMARKWGPQSRSSVLFLAGSGVIISSNMWGALLVGNCGYHLTITKPHSAFQRVGSKNAFSLCSLLLWGSSTPPPYPETAGK